MIHPPQIHRKTLCGPVCVISGYGRRAAAWQDPTHWRLVRVCIWRPWQVNSTEIGHPWKMLFKGNVWISRGHSFSRFHSCTVLLCCVCLLVINCSTSLDGDFYLDLSFSYAFVWSNPKDHNQYNSPRGIRIIQPNRPHNSNIQTLLLGFTLFMNILLSKLNQIYSTYESNPLRSLMNYWCGILFSKLRKFVHNLQEIMSEGTCCEYRWWCRGNVLCRQEEEILQGSYSSWYTDQGGRQKLLTLWQFANDQWSTMHY